MEIRNAFKALTDAKVDYVCLDGYQRGFMDSDNITILTLDPASIVRLLELQPRGRQHKFNPYYDLVHTGRTNTSLFAIYQKGMNYLPEKFETELLRGRVLYEHCVYVPAQEHELWIAIHGICTRGKGQAVTENQNAVLHKAMAQRLGLLPKSKYVSSVSETSRKERVSAVTSVP